MRVVQVANFYGPRSGGLRTAVDRLGAEYCAAGHEVFLVVPGRYSDWRELPSRVVRVSLPARLIPFTGGYRAALPGPVTSLLSQLSPDALEVSGRLTLRSLGGWGRRHDVATVMISHERLDRLVGQILPARMARSIANVANRRTAASYDAVVCTTAFAREEFDRIHAPNVVTVPLGVDLDQFHPRRHSATVRQRWARPEQTLLVHCGRLSVEKHAHRSIDTVAALRDSGIDARLVVVGEGPMRGSSVKPPACPSTSPGSSAAATPSRPSSPRPTSRWRPGRTKRSGWRHWRRWPQAHRRSCHGRRRWQRS
jgi:alpha-1,6-mannosyltransferase